MADLGGYLGDATSQIGQGLAFVLPGSNAEKYQMQLGQQHAADLRAMVTRKAQLQQQQEEEYQKSISAQKLPDYWAKAGQQINDNYNKWVKDAASFHATTGKDPYKNPDFIQRYNNEVVLPARQSKELETAYTTGLSKVAADADNKFTEESKNAFNQFVQGVDKNPLDYLGKPVPQLAGTPSGIDQFYKTLKPVSVTDDNGTVKTTLPDTSKMMEQAYLNSQDPRWNNLKASRYGINNDLGDIGSVYDKSGKRVWYTNPTATDHIAGEILANPTAPHNAEVLSKLGVTPDDPYAKERVQDAITKQNAGYGKFISEAGRFGNSLVNKSKDVTLDKWYEHYNYELNHPKPTKDKPSAEQITMGNQGSNVPVVKVNTANGTTGTVSSAEAEPGASLFSSNFDNQRVTVAPSNVVNLASGHSIKNTAPFNMDVGTIKMVPVFKDLDGKDSRNGAEVSLRQLKEIAEGKSKAFSLSNVEFKPYAYGQRPVTKDGKTAYEGVAIPYDAIRGNKKIPTQQFEKTVNQFQELLQSPDFKSLSAKQRLDFLQQQFNIK